MYRGHTDKYHTSSTSFWNGSSVLSLLKSKPKSIKLVELVCNVSPSLWASTESMDLNCDAYLLASTKLTSLKMLNSTILDEGRSMLTIYNITLISYTQHNLFFSLSNSLVTIDLIYKFAFHWMPLLNGSVCLLGSWPTNLKMTID